MSNRPDKAEQAECEALMRAEISAPTEAALLASGTQGLAKTKVDKRCARIPLDRALHKGRPRCKGTPAAKLQIGLRFAREHVDHQTELPGGGDDYGGRARHDTDQLLGTDCGDAPRW
jgi:hypothetical protein